MDMATVASVFFEYKEAFILLATMAFGPAAIAAAVATMRLPGFRHVIGGTFYALGKWISWLLIKRLGSAGIKLEEAFEEFLSEVIVGKFMDGLNSDDQGGKG